MEDDKRCTIEKHPFDINAIIVTTPAKDGTLRKEMITVRSPFAILEKARKAGV